MNQKESAKPFRRLYHYQPLKKPSAQQKAHILGRVPANVKFEVVKVFDDGSYLSWIAPDRKSKKKGAKRIKVRVIEYIIQLEGEEVIYRLITDLMDIQKFPALVLAQEYHSRWEIENTLDELKTQRRWT